MGTRTNRRATDPLNLLIEGNARYVANAPRQRDFSAGRACRARAQAPFAAILGCADSRVAPEFAFDQIPGDLFVVRLAGNLVTDEGLASLEFGAAVLGVRLILVLGHSGCGAVKATITALQEGNALPGHIADLSRAMKPGIAPVLKQSNGGGGGSGGGSDRLSCAVTANVRYNVERLRHAAPILANLVEGGELTVIGGVYDLATGKVELV